MLGSWTRLQVENHGYAGAVKASTHEPLPFMDEVFSLVLMRHALERYPATIEVLSDLVRTLMPGGLLVVAGIHPVSLWAPWIHWRTRHGRAILRMPFAVGRLLREAGLEIESTRRVGCPWPSASARPAGHAWVGGGYVLTARKRKAGVTPLRIRPAPLGVSAAAGALSPGTRRESGY
jgi:Methylase involved in ubiquinone/menaquinone biosynthesis